MNRLKVIILQQQNKSQEMIVYLSLVGIFYNK